MTSNIFFSIIIPIYDGMSNYMSECLDSIWHQPLSDDIYEVICIDDCSTDNSYSWLLSEQQKHHNLIVAQNEKNCRQGGSRNHGVKLAKGKYILFIDQDDYYHERALLKLYEHLKTTDVDVLVNDSVYQFRGHESNKMQLNYPSTEIMDWEQFAKTNYIAISPWRLTINREFYLSHDNRFVENCRIEDIDWGVSLMFHAKRVQYFPHILIHYNKAETGTTDNMYKNYEILLDNTKAGNRVLEAANTLYAESSIRNMVVRIACNTYTFSIKYMFGLWASIKKKREIIEMIPAIPTNSKIVKIAKSWPLTFSVGTNLAVPIFRIIRTIHRKRVAMSLPA